MRSTSPSVTVLTPSYGYGRFIVDALKSVRLQQRLEIEHVVQDGGSTDDTIEILQGFGGHGLVWSSERDRGQSDALNRAFAHAQGDAIAWLNADEFYLPGALERLAQTLIIAEADVVFGDCVFVDSEGRLLRLLPGHRFSRLVLRNYGPFIASCSTLFRRSVLGETPWDPGIDRVLDWDLYLRLANQGARFVYLPYPVGAFRVHPARITATPRERHAAHHEAVRKRYGLNGGAGSRVLGRALHAGLKAVSGSYRRQLGAEGLRGTDIRWFAGPGGKEGISLLLDRCYKLRRGRTARNEE
jgi:glycosyltransferase involved in cell wall biosynthesis